MSSFTLVKASCRNRITLASSLSTCQESAACPGILSRNYTSYSAGPCKILVNNMLELVPIPGTRCSACKARWVMISYTSCGRPACAVGTTKPPSLVSSASQLMDFCLTALQPGLYTVLSNWLARLQTVSLLESFSLCFSSHEVWGQTQFW